jgi:3-oxoacyl-[acyl-carrier protein] reductase
MSIDGKTAIVTGGSQGIGLAVTERLVEAGGTVMICDINEEGAEQAAQKIRDAGGRASAAFADVTDPDSLKAMVAKTLDEFGRIDILVNNAGIVSDSLMLRMKEENWQSVIDTNLTGVFNCTKAVLRTMAKQKYGRIVTIGSVVGINGNAGQANYAAAKAGVIGFTKTVSREMAGRGITANVVAPGFIETAMTLKLSDDVRNAILERITAGRLGTARDVAECVLFLASDAASYITGQVIPVDGGLNM